MRGTGRGELQRELRCISQLQKEGSPVHRMTLDPASSWKAIKGGLSQEESHFSGNSPLIQISSLQPTNQQQHQHQQQQQQQQTSPAPHYRILRRRRSGPVSDPGTALLHYNPHSSEWHPIRRTFHHMGIRKNKIVHRLTSKGGESTLPSPLTAAPSPHTTCVGLWLNSLCNTLLGLFSN